MSKFKSNVTTLRGSSCPLRQLSCHIWRGSTFADAATQLRLGYIETYDIISQVTWFHSFYFIIKLTSSLNSIPTK